MNHNDYVVAFWVMLLILVGIIASNIWDDPAPISERGGVQQNYADTRP